MATKTCQICNQKFTKGLRRSNPSWATAKYCSLSCTYKSKIGKPSGTFGKPSKGKGIPLSSEQKLKISASKIGCTPWNKGLGKPRVFDIRRTRKFKEFRVSILIKSSYLCAECGVVNGRLEIDHIKPVRFFPELVLDENNVRVLCRDCHKKTDTYGAKIFKTYGYAK